MNTYCCMHFSTFIIFNSRYYKYFPTGRQFSVQYILHKCSKCFKANHKATSPRMSKCSVLKIAQNHPFWTIHIDYTGAFLLNKHGHSSKRDKCYICVFVCFTTKSIDLKAVLDLTTESFVAATKILSSRHCMSNNVYSDNGSNFISIHKEIENLFNFLAENEKLFNIHYPSVVLRDLLFHLRLLILGDYGNQGFASQSITSNEY